MPVIHSIATIGPHTGLRVYPLGENHQPAIWMEASARKELLGLARSALGKDGGDPPEVIALKKGDLIYAFPAGLHFAGQIIAALQARA